MHMTSSVLYALRNTERKNTSGVIRMSDSKRHDTAQPYIPSPQREELKGFPLNLPYQYYRLYNPSDATALFPMRRYNNITPIVFMLKPFAPCVRILIFYLYSHLLAYKIKNQESLRKKSSLNVSNCMNNKLYVFWLGFVTVVRNLHSKLSWNSCYTSLRLLGYEIDLLPGKRWAGKPVKPIIVDCPLAPLVVCMIQ